RAHPGGASERGDLDPRVLAERPFAGPVAEARLRPRVLVVAPALLGRHRFDLEELDPPARKRVRQLASLVRVLRGEPRRHSPHCTALTPSRSLTAASTASRVFGGKSTSSARLRRSSSSASASDSTCAPAPSTASSTTPGGRPRSRSTSRRSRSGRNRTTIRWTASRNGHRLRITRTVVIAAAL